MLTWNDRIERIKRGWKRWRWWRNFRKEIKESQPVEDPRKTVQDVDAALEEVAAGLGDELDEGDQPSPQPVTSPTTPVSTGRAAIQVATAAGSAQGSTTPVSPSATTTTPSATAGGTGGSGSGSGGGNMPPPEDQSSDSESTGPLKQPRPLSAFWIPVGIFYSLYVAISTILILFTTWNEKDGLNPGWLMLIVLGVYSLLSFRSVKEVQIASRFFFGQEVSNLESGPTFIPLFFCSITRFPKKTIIITLPGPKEKLYPGEGVVPAGFKRTFRVSFAGKLDATDPLERPLTTEVNPFVRLKINNPCTFVGAIGSIAEARKQLSEVCLAFFTEELSPKSLRHVMNNLAYYNYKLTKLIEARVEKWGVDFISAQISELPLSHGLNIALQTGALETANSLGVEARAQGKKKELVLEGQGRGEARAAEINAETGALVKRQEDTEMPPHVTLAAQVARDVATESGNNFFVGAGAYEQPVGILAAVASALKNQPKPKAQPAESVAASS